MSRGAPLPTRRARPRRSAALAALAAGLAALLAAGDAAAVLLRPQYRIEATLHPARPQLEGTAEVAFTNRSGRALQEAVFLNFANRFAEPDAVLDDFTRPLVYPQQTFDPGGLELLEVRDGERPAVAEPLPVDGLPLGTFVRVPIASLAPGASRTLTLRFRTTVPERFGSFGVVDDRLTALGGWYPSLVHLDAAGTWAIGTPPPAADFDVTLQPAPGLEVILNGRLAPAGAPLRRVRVPGAHYLTLLAAPRFRRAEIQAGETRIVFLYPPTPRSHRLAFGPDMPDIVLDALRDIVLLRPAAVPAAPELVVVAAPLRLILTAPGEGAVVVSDRLLEVLPVLRRYHELQLAEAVYAELLRPRLSPREPPGDYVWVGEGAARLLAARHLDRIDPERRSVYDWIDQFNAFAVVDRFEITPRIPFRGAFFDGAREADPLRAEIWSVTDDGPPGRVTLAKLRALLGPAAFDALLDACLTGPVPMRRCLVDGAPGEPVAARLAEWTGPYPAIDYVVESTDFNAPDGDGYRSTVRIRRDSSRPFEEPVTVRLQSIGGEPVDVQWRGDGGDVAVLSARTESRAWRAVIDPDRALIDDDRRNNAWWPRTQVVLDSADVEVSSTEFAFAALAVGRLRYDYTKDLAVTGFYTNRGIGFAAGPRLHWGTPVDGSKFRHNLYTFYRFEALDSSFHSDEAPQRRTGGLLAGFGARYDYSNVYWIDAPSRQRKLRLYVDWFDAALGGDYDYVDWGVVASATMPLGSPRTVLAGEVLNGFSEPFRGVVPNQGLYSLGGERSIRGIGAEERLARNIAVLRTELRREVGGELAYNFMDLAILRRVILRGLLDGGQVSNSAGRIYDVGGWAVGAGVGLGVRYDVMGFFPASAYLDVATRLDEDQGEVQVLFGSSQTF